MKGRFEVILIVACVVIASAVHVVGQDKKLSVEGKVVAFEASPLSLTRLTDVPRQQLFFVRISKVVKGESYSKYIKVVYKYFEESDIHRALIEENSLWKFTLIRNKECDQSAKPTDGDPKIVALPGAESLPPNYLFPCYSLNSKKLRRIDD